MFRSSTIIREPALNLAKVIFMLKHSVNYVVIYYAVVWQHAATQPHNTRHIRKVRAVSLYLNIGGSEQSCTHAAPSIECLRSH